MAKEKVPAASRVTKQERRELDSLNVYQYDDNGDDSIFKVPPEIEAEGKTKGFVFRWINAAKYRGSSNFHARGWQAYRRETGAVKSAAEFAGGTSPEGYIIRDDMILAFKPDEVHEKYRQKVKMRTDALAGKDDKRGDLIRDIAKEHGVDAAVFDTYEDKSASERAGTYKEIESDDE